ncbi:MAG: CofH family radical SAM protein [Mucinivorans sp.]
MYEKIIEKALSGAMISPAEAIELWHDAPLAELGKAAREIKVQHSGNTVFYNRNIHIEPTNICAFRCAFCSYRRAKGEEGAWYYTLEQVAQILETHAAKPITEVHIVGGVHPDHDFQYYIDLISLIHKRLPNVAIKAFTAVELDYIIKKEGISLHEGLHRLKQAGMSAIPGGGAEIFVDHIRRRICPEKCSASDWLNLHRTAHELGITSNATILYGHIETIDDRIDHLLRLRNLQAETGGFSAFIPLKFRTAHNLLGENMSETTLVEDMRMMALTRIMLNNFAHIKAYWPMLGLEATQMALSFGADDIDGTIDDTTKIYSMAGAEIQKPQLTVAQCKELIAQSGFTPVERDTYYNSVSNS